MTQSCSHSNAICNYRFKNRIELRTQEQPLVAKHREGTTTTAPGPAAHRRYLSSPAAATLDGKTQGFLLRLPLQNKAHATFMQPSQCVSQHPIANLHVSTHIATEHDTIMQPFQCDLQLQIQEPYRTTHTGTTTRCKTQRRNHNDRTRTRCTQEVPFIAGRSHSTRKNTRFRAPASSPK